MITPGQLGPINLEVFELLITRETSIISRIGIPSVIQIIRGIPASSASKIEFAANGGGTNNPPEPPTITGPTRGKAGEEHEYTFNSEDPEGEDVSYYIRWGDGQVILWTDFQPSGDTYVESHTWAEEGNYILEAKAKDIHGDESDWNRISVRMPKNKALINSPLLQRILERYPNLSLILRYFLGL